ncbi:FHA domain-containing protein [Citrus sinensis]|uniref:FHA domain-containing protein n=1 Tax=Citrus sinensis TaxID=2711 RepID=A0ACB8MSX6_CITSI|nr:FHA domain-containing protein [Citrus sinensis]
MDIKEDRQEKTPTVPKSTPSPSPKEKVNVNASQSSSSHPPHQNPNATSPKKAVVPSHFVFWVAGTYAAQPLQNYDPKVWGVLTAISNNARKRHQGINILLTADEHCIGRLVDDAHFQIDSNAVSANHCKIYRKKFASGDLDHSPSGCSSVCLKDTSTNGTYVNCERFKKNSSEVNIDHGDIISFAAPPQHDLAFAFVFRDVSRSTPTMEGAAAKRKAEEYVSDNKRLKGIGICSPDGPLSLDDFRSLQRSNTELRKQLESQVLEIDKLRNENRVVVERHEKEMKEMKESVSISYLHQLKVLRDMLDAKQKELAEISRISAEQKHEMEDLNDRLSASMQSCTEANEIMKSQKVTIDELKTQLDEERNLRRVDRENAEADLKAAVQKSQLETQEKLKRLSDAASRRELEQQEVINKLQIAEKQSSLQVESLKLKLDETRERLVTSDNKVRLLETQRVEELENEIKKLREELESEKAAREVAWAKVSGLELDILAATRDLDFERRRLKAARERIMLRETQLRAFYSTTEEISVLFARQQEQLKAMQKTLEDEENYENTSVDIDLCVPDGENSRTIVGEKLPNGHHSNSAAKADSSGEASTTEKHDCDIRSQEEGQNTQEAEFTSGDRTCKGGFGSDIDGVGTGPILEGDPIGTEQVHETESPGIDGEQNIDLNKPETLAGETMQLEDEAHGHEIDEQIPPTCQETVNHSQLNNPLSQKTMEDTIRTADLLASEVAGSWACSTAPSVHGENESPRSRDNNEEGPLGPHDFSAQAAESQNLPSSKAAPTKWSHDRQALCEMIGIVTPELKVQFGGAVDNDLHQGTGKSGSISSSDTECCGDSDDNDGADTKCSGADNDGSNPADEDQNNKDDAMDEDDEATQEDSVG